MTEKTVKEMKIYCKHQGIKGYSKLKKIELKNLISKYNKKKTTETINQLMNKKPKPQMDKLNYNKKKTTETINQLMNKKPKPQMDKLNELISRFKYWNNRGKSAIARYILKELGVTEKEFINHLHGWKERQLIINKNGFFEVIIKPYNR